MDSPERSRRDEEVVGDGEGSSPPVRNASSSPRPSSPPTVRGSCWALGSVVDPRGAGSSSTQLFTRDFFQVAHQAID